MERGLFRSWVEPRGVVALVERDGHAIVHLGDLVARGTCDDGARLDRDGGPAARALPSIPKAGHPERGMIGALDEVGQLLFALELPLVEAVGEDQTATLLERVTEGAARGDGLDAGVDEGLGIPKVVHVEGDEPPPHQDELSLL